jgi:hypothetical protein
MTDRELAQDGVGIPTPAPISFIGFLFRQNFDKILISKEKLKE